MCVWICEKGPIQFFVYSAFLISLERAITKLFDDTISATLALSVTKLFAFKCMFC